MIWLLACAEPDVAADTGFYVVSSLPEHNATDVVVAQIVELRFSAEVDADACGPEQLRLDAISDDHTVAFPVEVTLETLTGGHKIRLDPDTTLSRGWLYALSVRGGEDGCRDVSGREVEPFYASFSVP